MHDALDIDDGLGLELIDPADHLAVLLVIVLRVGDPELIDAHGEIDLAELCLGEQVPEGPFRGLFPPGGIVHDLAVIKKVIDGGRLPGQEGGRGGHVPVFIQADCPGIPHKEGIREILVIHLLQVIEDSVGSKESLLVRVEAGPLRGQVSVLGDAVVLCAHDLAAGRLRDRPGLCFFFFVFCPCLFFLVFFLIFFLVLFAVRLLFRSLVLAAAFSGLFFRFFFRLFFRLIFQRGILTGALFGPANFLRPGRLCLFIFLRVPCLCVPAVSGRLLPVCL